MRVTKRVHDFRMKQSMGTTFRFFLGVRSFHLSWRIDYAFGTRVNVTTYQEDDT